jgi:histone acetyltransferase (RNA polymerase elongator complex component)
MEDIEDLLLKAPYNKAKFVSNIKDGDCEKYKPLLDEIISFINSDKNVKNKEKNVHKIRAIMSKHKYNTNFSYLLKIYHKLVLDKVLEKNILLEKTLRTRNNKSTSGVIVLTVVFSPYPTYVDEYGETIEQKFTCQWNCYYCPNEPDQPRSYLKLEPAVERANKSKFDAFSQVNSRLTQLKNIGHEIDKVEIIVLGGTLESYPIEYREEFIRDLFYALNVFYETLEFDKNDKNDKNVNYDNTSLRSKLSLKEEQKINESARVKVVALKLETRPDTVTADSVKHLRYLGCTHLQIGVQHIYDRILKKINRQAYYADTVRAIKILKNLCFKIDIHIMPMLPEASPEIDQTMFEEFLGIIEKDENLSSDCKIYKYILQNEYLQADEWKIYPCQTVPWTVIKKWYEEGKYVPYDEKYLVDILKFVDERIFPWIRLNRVIRDIPVKYVIGGITCTNMRQLITQESEKNHVYSMDIRNREVKDGTFVSESEIFPIERWYNSSDGQEIFLSYESKDEKILYGLLRLRFSPESGYIDNEVVFPELVDTACIRQIHVYGELQKVLKGDNNNHNNVQHRGIGKRLIKRAEDLARKFHYKRIAVIASIGTRNYYRKFNYEVCGEGEYMIKQL